MYEGLARLLLVMISKFHCNEWRIPHKMRRHIIEFADATEPSCARAGGGAGEGREGQDVSQFATLARMRAVGYGWEWG